MQPNHDEIAFRAYERWLARDGAPGDAEGDWLSAERDLAQKSVVLVAPGDEPIMLIRELRAITGLSLDAVKRLAEKTPCVLQEAVPSHQAEQVRERLAALGARVELRPST